VVVLTPFLLLIAPFFLVGLAILLPLELAGEVVCICIDRLCSDDELSK